MSVIGEIFNQIHLRRYAVAFERQNNMPMISKCSLCGEPMPAGEEMFKVHGYSGPCPKPTLQTVDSTSDNRTVNNTLRQEYRVLSDKEKEPMARIKSCGQELLDIIAECGARRELSIAKTKTEEAVMWAVKHVTA